MLRINQEMAGLRLPGYVEEILTQNYCSSFMRMSIIKNSDNYSFSYRPEGFSRLDAGNLKLYDKLLLLRNIISISETADDQLVAAEDYLLEPELVYSRGGRIDEAGLKLMFYPDTKRLDFRFKIVLFADRIMDKSVREEREMAERIREAAEPGDINRIKMLLEKNILRIEGRMIAEKS